MATSNQYGFEPVAPMAQVTTPGYTYTATETPNYKGLMGGDFEAYQKALYDPAAQAAQTAFNQQSANLNNTMGGRGLYGSSIMQNQATNQLGAQYQNTLANAASAAARGRYEMQANQLNNQNDFNKGIYVADLGRENLYNQYGLSASNNEMTQATNYAKLAQAEALRKQSYYQQLEQDKMNWAKVAQQDQLMKNQVNSGYMNAGVSALGGLLSQPGQNAIGSIGGGLSSLYNAVSGWLGGGTSYGDYGNESDWSSAWDNYEATGDWDNVDW